MKDVLSASPSAMKREVFGVPEIYENKNERIQYYSDQSSAFLTSFVPESLAGFVPIHKFGVLFSDPLDEFLDFYVVTEPLHRVVMALQLLLGENTVNFGVANAMKGEGFPSFLGFRNQMVLVHRRAGDQGPSAKRAGGKLGMGLGIHEG